LSSAVVVTFDRPERGRSFVELLTKTDEIRGCTTFSVYNQ